MQFPKRARRLLCSQRKFGQFGPDPYRFDPRLLFRRQVDKLRRGNGVIFASLFIFLECVGSGGGGSVDLGSVGIPPLIAINEKQVGGDNA